MKQAASGGLLWWSSASLCPALLQLLPQAVGLDQHILRISKLLLPLVAKAAKVAPVSRSEPLDQFEVDLSAVLLHHHAESIPRLVPRAAGGDGGIAQPVWNYSEAAAVAICSLQP